MDGPQLVGNLMPREWSDYDFDHHGPYRGRSSLRVTVILTSLACFVVTLRLGTRVWVIKNIGYEDYLIIAAMGCSVAYMGLIIGETHHGMGYHLVDLPGGEFQGLMKFLWASFPTYNASLSFTKVSVLCQYLRLFPNRTLIRWCYGAIAAIAVFFVWAVVSGFLTCMPVSYFWNRSVQGKCLSFTGVWVFNSLIHMLSDIVLMVLPLQPLRRLQLPKAQKFGLSILFIMGALVVLISIFRIYPIYVLSISSDVSWDNVNATCWTASECNVSIMCACLPLLRPLFRNIPTLNLSSFTSRNSTRNTNKQGTDRLGAIASGSTGATELVAKESHGAIEVRTEVEVSNLLRRQDGLGPQQVSGKSSFTTGETDRGGCIESQNYKRSTEA